MELRCQRSLKETSSHQHVTRTSMAPTGSEKVLVQFCELLTYRSSSTVLKSGDDITDNAIGCDVTDDAVMSLMSL